MAFFAVVGTVVAVVSLARPEEESAETRARILFRRKTGRHIDYMVDKIGHIFEQYSEVVENKIEILDFCDNKFLLGFEGHTRLRSYIDDIPSNYTSHMEMAGIGPPPAGKDDKPNRIVRLLVNEQSQHKQAALGDSFKFEFTTVIQPNEACDIRQRFELWVEAENEPSAFVAVRYTQLVGLRLDNLWNKDVFVQVLVEDRVQDEFRLNAGSPRNCLQVADVEPGKTVYDIRFRAA